MRRESGLRKGRPAPRAAGVDAAGGCEGWPCARPRFGGGALRGQKRCGGLHRAHPFDSAQRALRKARRVGQPRVPQRLKPGFIFWGLCGTSELVPFPSAMGRSVLCSVWAVLGLSQRLKPGFIFWGLYGTSELVPFPSVMGLRFVVCFGYSRLASAAEAELHFLGPLWHESTRALPEHGRPSDPWFCLGCSRLTSAAEAVLPFCGLVRHE
jgi:hypothetical protein